MALHFNQELQNKYPHLEVSVLKYSDAMTDNDSKRIDSEFFKKEYLEKLERLNAISTRLKNLMVSGYYGILPKSDDYIENGLSLIRGKDIRETSLNRNNLIKVPFDYWQERYQIHKNDILFLVKGATIGYSDGVLLITEEPNEKMIFNGSVFKLRVKDINPYFLYSYMMTSYFTMQKLREVANNGIEYNSLPTIKNFLIPLFPLKFQQQIEQIVRRSHECLEQSKDLYREAEVLLYEELGLNPQNPLYSVIARNEVTKQSREKNEKFETSKTTNAVLDCHDFATQSLAMTNKYAHLNISVRPLSQSLNATGRLDSEYYQQKYDEIEKVIKNYRGGYFQLSLSELKDKNFTPQAQTKYRYIELANIGTNGNISEPIVDFGENLPSRARRIVKTGDMIISSVEGSLQSCALITDEFDNCIVSTGFYVLKSSNLNSETLLVLFKSKLFQDYLHKFSSGTILTAISKDELQNILIPKIAQQTQTQIAEKIKQSFALRKQANELLQQAKFKVEIAIEQPSF